MNHTQVVPGDGSPGALEIAEYAGVKVMLDASSNLSNWACVDVGSLEAEAVAAERREEIARLGRYSRRVRFHEAWREDDWGQAGSPCGGASAEKKTPEGVKVVPMLCGKWSCPVCGWLKYKWFVSNLSQAALDHDLRYFWTLTVPAGATSAIESYGLLTKSWNNLRTQMVKKYGPVKFVWVLESQRSGYAHLHILMDTRVDVVWLRAAWSLMIPGAVQMRVEEVRDNRGVQYLAKYLSKQTGRVQTPDGIVELVGLHRYGKSRGIDFTPYRVPGSGWKLSMAPFKESMKWDVGRGSVLSACTRGVPWYLRDYGFGDNRPLGPWVEEMGMEPVEMDAEVLRLVRDG